MKKIILFTLSLFLFLGTISSQVVVDIINTDNEVITGTNLKFYNIMPNSENNFYFSLRNNTNNIVEFRMRVFGGDCEVTDWKYQFCTPETSLSGGACAMPNVQSAIMKLAANEVVDDAYVKFIQGSSLGTACIEVEIFDVNGVFSSSFDLTFTSDSPVNISNNIAKEFSVYPNPANNNFKINHNYGSNAVVEVYNMLGKLVTKVKSSSSSVNIDSSKWDNGYYFCRLYSDGKIEKTIKLVVAH